MEQTRRFRFAGFELDAELGLLSRDGQAVHIGYKPFCALALLVARDGALVTREELQREMWRDGVHVNFDHGLNEVIRQVRAALGDEDETKRIIVTYPRRGYRLNVPAERVDVPVVPGSGASDEVDSGTPPVEPADVAVPAVPAMLVEARGPARTTQRWAVASALVAAIVSIFMLWQLTPVTQARLADISEPAATPLAAGDSDNWTSRLVPRSLLLSPRIGTPVGEAHVWYGRALAAAEHEWYPESPETIQDLERAVALDPDFDVAQARLAIAYSEQVAAGLDLARSRPNAQRALEAATRIASSRADTRVAAAEVKFRLESDYAGAERLFTEAIALSPTSALSHLRYSMFLQKQLRFDEAIAQLRNAERLDPVSLRVRWELGYVLFLSGRCPEALVQVGRALELDPNHAKSYWTRGRCLEAMGRQNEAVEAYEAAGRIGLPRLAGMYARTGRSPDARRILATLVEQRSERDSGYAPLAVAYVYSELGEHAKVLDCIKEMQSRGVQLPIGLRIAPEWTSLRADPEFNHIESDIEGARATNRVELDSVHDRF